MINLRETINWQYIFQIHSLCSVSQKLFPTKLSGFSCSLADWIQNIALCLPEYNQSRYLEQVRQRFQIGKNSTFKIYMFLYSSVSQHFDGQIYIERVCAHSHVWLEMVALNQKELAIRTHSICSALPCNAEAVYRTLCKFRTVVWIEM